CPSDPRAANFRDPASGYGLTDYVGVEGTNTAGNGTRDGLILSADDRQSGIQVRLADVIDGTSSTLMIGERPAGPDRNWGWWFTEPVGTHLGVLNTAFVYGGRPTAPPRARPGGTYRPRAVA